MKKKYKVYFDKRHTISTIVEAESIEEADEIAEENFDKLSWKEVDGSEYTENLYDTKLEQKIEQLKKINKIKETYEETFDSNYLTSSKKNIDKYNNDEIVERLKKYIELLKENINELYDSEKIKMCSDNSEFDIIETIEQIRDNLITQVLKKQ